MTQPHPFPVDDGSLAMAVLVQLLKTLAEKNVLSVGDIQSIFAGVVADAGSAAAQSAARSVLNTVFPDQIKV